MFSFQIMGVHCRVGGWSIKSLQSFPVLDLSGLTPSGASQPPKFVLTPEKIVKIRQKYIADPSGFPTNQVLIVSGVASYIC